MSDQLSELPSPPIGCLTPSILPDLEHLWVILTCEHTYYLTDEPFSRKSRAHRGQINTAAGAQWLTLPIRPDDKKKPLYEVRPDASENWPDLFLKVLQTNYGNSRYFDFYQPEIESDLRFAAGLDRLIDIIPFLNNRLFCYLELENIVKTKTSYVLTAAFNDKMEQHSGVEPSTVIIESRGQFYRKPGNTRLFTIRQADLRHPVYRQLTNEFRPGCCLLDLLFQYGPYSFEVLDQLLP